MLSYSRFSHLLWDEFKVTTKSKSFTMTGLSWETFSYSTGSGFSARSNFNGMNSFYGFRTY